VRYLVTGGAGFIGSALVKRLLADGHEVSVLDDYSRGKRSRLPARPGLQVFQGDIRNGAAVTMAMHGCDSVVHLAYMQGTQTFYSEPRAVLDVALRGILNVLDACAVTGCPELLLVSSSEAYQVASVVPTPEDIALTVPDPLNPRYSYGGGKIACELAVLAWQRAGVLDRVLIARPHNVYGPDMGREHVIPEFCLRMNALADDPLYSGVRAGEVIPFRIQGSGQETRSFCYIDDCVDQLDLLLSPGSAVPSHGAEVYHVGTMDEHSIADVAVQVAACYGREIKIEPGRLPEGSPLRRLPDMRKMTRLQGGVVRPVPFAEGLRRTVSWYRANG
jgi:dTDP-glucose 4,6-dehydratase/UDP-glucose 4-epimerase